MAEQDRRRTIELCRRVYSRLRDLGRRHKSQPPEFGVQVAADMVVVPAGEFLMGTTDQDANRVIAKDRRVRREWMNNEQPQHVVHLDAYAIDVHPVTVAQYRAFCEATGRSMPKAPSWGWLDDHPVANVSWRDAVAYCQWAGKRLPTEAEWEKAARGVDGRAFPWGNEWRSSAVHSVSCDEAPAYRGLSHGCGRYPPGSQAAPVRTHPEGASPYGCQDMIGNVWEWCADWYADLYYRDSPGENPPGPDRGYSRVLRGGSWWHIYSYWLRCAFRGWDSPGVRRDDLGFRCAQDLPSRR